MIIYVYIYIYIYIYMHNRHTHTHTHIYHIITGMPADSFLILHTNTIRYRISSIMENIRQCCHLEGEQITIRILATVLWIKNFTGIHYFINTIQLTLQLKTMALSINVNLRYNYDWCRSVIALEIKWFSISLQGDDQKAINRLEYDKYVISLLYTRIYKYI